MKLPSIKETVKDLVKQFGEEDGGASVLTQAHFEKALAITEAALLAPKAATYVHCRDNFVAHGEYVGGERIGEVAGAGDGHGMTANDVKFRPGHFAGVLKHTKTAEHVSYIDCAVPTASGYDISASCTRMISAHPRQTLVQDFDEWGAFERPDYYVAKVPCAGKSDEWFSNLDKIMTRFPSHAARDRKHRIFLRQRFEDRRNAQDEHIRYINVWGGSHDDMVLATEYLAACGVECELLDGPLICSTRDNGIVTDMPLSTRYAGERMGKLFTAAHIALLEEGHVSTTLLPGKALKWTSHSGRRGGTLRCRSLMAQAGITPELIDIHFRWNEAKMRKTMAIHYTGDRPVEERLRVTSLM